MLHGRRAERARIAALLAGAREGQSGVLVVRREAGVGKRTLLHDAAEQADGFQLLHGAGVESEVELPFAALQQLLRPILHHLDRLPAPQASALRGAFGLLDTQPNRFLIELGVLTLLAEAAKEQPLLCEVADAQWLDRASADALVFVARRLEAEPIVLLLAAGDDSRRQFDAPGLPELHLGGLASMPSPATSWPCWPGSPQSRDAPRTAGGSPTRRSPPPPRCGWRWSRRSPPGRSRRWT